MSSFKYHLLYVASIMFVSLSRPRTTMIGAPEPLEIAKLCEGGGPVLEFLPLVFVARNSIPSSRLARHLTLRLHLHFALFNQCIAGMLSQESVPPKLWDGLPLSEPHSTARSRHDLRPRCSTVLRMSLYLRARRKSTTIAATH